MSKTAAIVFFGIIAIGVVTSLILLNYFGETVEQTEPSPLVSEIPASSETPESAPESPSETKETKTQATKSQDSPVEGAIAAGPFASPKAAMKALSSLVATRNFEAFEAFVGPEAIAPAIKPEVEAIIENPKFSISKKKPFSEISKSADSVRWSLNLEPLEPGPTKELYADLKPLEENQFDLYRIQVPISPATSPLTTENGGNDAMPPSDPLTIAHAFSKAVVSRDFETARSLSDPESVTDERVAALMIALEEGKFSLREDRPLVVTLSREDITWVLSRIQSPSSSSEFALELGPVKDLWRVKGLTFSKVLSALADAGGGGDIAYSPIVEDPAGGDSLVLYFEFDESQLTSRGRRQLAIVADILSQGAERVIRINGHADALGSDQYNEGLSTNRAESIRAALISMGVSPNQVVTEGFGESQPRRPNFKPDGSDNPAGRSKNRRAEVYLDF
ncbi:MAG: OmpA family protein [Verrucomicrobiota bacterium]